MEGVDNLDVRGRIGNKKRRGVARRKAVGDERSRNVLDALVERLERNSGTVDNQRRALCVIPECPAERMNVNHRVLSNEGAPGAAKRQPEHFTDSTDRKSVV